MQRFWSYDIRKNNYIPTDSEPFSTFPTIVDTKNMKVWCRSCHRWENIIAFSQNVLKTECRKLYAGPFTPDNSEFSYGFDVSQPATNAQEAVQWTYFAYLAAVKSQNGAAMSFGRTSTFLDI